MVNRALRTFIITFTNKIIYKHFRIYKYNQCLLNISLKLQFSELDAVKDAPSDAKKISIEPETILKNADMNRLNHINMDNVLSNNEKAIISFPHQFTVSRIFNNEKHLKICRIL